MKYSILITGASGFIGSYAVKELQKIFNISCVSLRKTPIDKINFKGIDVILHLAGKAHQMTKIDPNEYFDINHKLTISLAKAAKENGVKHFIFMSTVKVYGDVNDKVFDEFSECHPTDPYGESKKMAEEDLLKMLSSDFAISIIRPPLVYGPNVKGNLKRLQKLITQLPYLPFGKIDNERSMVFVGNLTALVILIIENVATGVFIAGDKSRVSTTILIDTMIKAMGIDKKNLSIPEIFRQTIALIKPDLYSRLFESYIIDNTKTNKRLNFIPPYSFEEGVKIMVSSKN